MFKNVAIIDWTLDESRQSMQSAIDTLHKNIHSKPLQAFPIVNGQEVKSSEVFNKISPNDNKTILGNIHFADATLTANALQGLLKAKDFWAKTPLEKRAEILKKAAAIMDQERHRLNALICLESAKPWAEADKDTVEAIDFCNYYAEIALKQLSKFRTQETPGEANFYFYEPRGLAIVIGPWNFPLAIPCGMLVAALVCGNVAVLKPAEQSSLIAYELIKILFRAGLPENVVAFLPGQGEIIGQQMIDFPHSDLICFTGSLAVGKHIIKACGEIHPESLNIKRAIVELGGKNAIIVDDDADIDEAIKGILYSAFGYAGQKCSACSRLIVVGQGYENLISRLTKAAADLIIGPSYESASFVGPVIDSEAQERILKIIEGASKKYTPALKTNVPGNGAFVPITIFTDVPPADSLFQEEIFGPVLAVTRAKNLEEAINIANSTKYALTGGLYSRSPANIEKATRDFKVGNLYINRACTGAIVERHPFGGFRMSGIGSKAGGPDYLKQFVFPRLLSENTLRKGFTPDL